MKKITFLTILFATVAMIAQSKKSTTLGKTRLSELKMSYYDKDSTANALVLFEQANRYPDVNNDDTPRTDYYFRIKIFDKSAFDLADIKIYLRKSETLLDVKAITYNLTSAGGLEKNNLDDKSIYTLDESGNWTSKKFTLPSVKERSVIEYKYSILSPYLVIDNWYFQSDIPKLRSEFSASILGNYKYNIKLLGFQKLDINTTSIDKKCVYIDGIGDGACALYTYVMKDIPAFKEEDFMLSKKNYISKISFDIKSSTSYRGEIKKYTTTWKKADQNIKRFFFNKQTSKTAFFNEQLPETILTTQDQLERAKKVYAFIQNHYTWNGDYWKNSDAKIKNAFKEKSGDVGEINLSLFNSLNAANIQTKLVVLSTRNNGIPSKLYPIIFDYNYVIVEVTIAGKKYYLDATDKFLPFGQVPFKAINGEARVLDFNKKSTWVKLKPQIKSSINTIVKLELNESNELEGTLIISRLGYYAINQRKKIHSMSTQDYLEDFETKYIDTEVDSINIKNLNQLDEALSEFLKIKIIEQETLGNKIKINPILFNRLKKNPFKLMERQFPVDFGHTKKQSYSFSLKIPDGYKIVQVPKMVAISLPNKGGSFVYKTFANENEIRSYVRFNVSRPIFSSQEYFALKEFYKQVIIAENSFLVLEKR